MRLYLDSAYIAKCYLRERGTDAVLDLVESSSSRGSSELAMLEVVAVFHRHLREGKLSRAAFEETFERFKSEDADGVWQWIPVDSTLLGEAALSYRKLSSSLFLRSADCLHLVSARRAGFRQVHSNDKRLLEACPHFDMEGIDVIDSFKFE